MSRLLIIGTAVIGLAACSSGGSTGSESDVTTTDEMSESSPTVVDLDVVEDVRPDRVLLAAAILATGDIEAAVSEGLVTPREVDAAVAAIVDDDLERWQDLADSEP